MRSLAAALLLLTQAQDSRLPIPEAAAQKSAEKLVRDVFKDDYSRKDAASRRPLALKLLKQAGESADDPAARFVLLSEARDVAADAGDLRTALSAVQQLAKIYAVNPIASRKQALDRARKAVAPEDLAALAEAYLQTADDAAAADDFESALAAARDAEQTAVKAKVLPLVTRTRARGKELATLRTESAKIPEAWKKLETTPEDPEASLTLGRHLCFRKGEWAKGLLLLAAGSDEALKTIARKDLVEPTDAAGQAGLADQWWDLAEKEEGSAAAYVGGRAAFWYERALLQSTGLQRVKIEKRLADLKQRGVRSESGAPVPTQGLIGWWKLDEGGGEQAAESIGGAAHGKLAKGPAWVPGRRGGALSFDGVDDFVAIPWTVGKGVGESFTMALWASPKAARKPTPESNAGSSGGGGQRYAIFPANAQWEYPPGHSYAGISIGTNGIAVYEHGSGYLPALLVHDVEIRDWVHVAVVYTANQPRLYLDGKPARTGLKSTKTVHPGTSLGEAGVGYGYYCGLLDDVRLYNRPLIDAEIRSLAAEK